MIQTLYVSLSESQVVTLSPLSSGKSIEAESLLSEVRERAYQLVWFNYNDLTAPYLESSLKFLKEHNYSEKFVLLLPGPSFTAERICELFRLGVYDVIVSDSLADVALPIIARVSENLKCEAIAIKLFSGVKDLKMSFELTAESLRGDAPALSVVEQLYAANFLPRNEYLKVKLALQEALTNANLHGNLALDSKWKEEYDNEGIDIFSLKLNERLKEIKFAHRLLKIEIGLSYSKVDDKGMDLRITITDEGDGFPLEKRELDLNDDKQLTGRGIKLMRWGMDEVLFNDKGNSVTLIKHLHTVK